MSSPLETQAKVWVDTISNEKTISSYQAVFQTLMSTVTALWDAIQVSWNIVKETGKLIWLFICFGLVASDWLWDSSKNLIEKVKDFSTHANDPKSDTYIVDTGKALFEASKTGAVNAVSQARKQLGLPKNNAGETVKAAPASSAPPKATPSTPNAAPAPQAEAPTSTEDA